jgi:hypothetical protein
MQTFNNCKVIKKLPAETVNDKHQKAALILLSDEEYEKEFRIDFWNAAIKQMENINVGDVVSGTMSLSSREHNGRWYTDVKANKIQVDSKSMPEETYPPHSSHKDFPV